MPHVTPVEGSDTVNRLIGIVLVAAGALGLAWGGISYTTREKAIDIGPLQVTREKTHSVPLAPIGSAVLLTGGIVLLVAGRNRVS